MKKILLSLMMLGVLFACSHNTSEDQENHETNATSKKSANEAEKAGIDRNALNVEVTLPPSLVETEEEDLDQSITEAEAEGMQVQKNNDGGLTYKMSESKHEDMMNELRKDAQESIAELTESGNFPSIHTIENNDALSEFEVVVDQESYKTSMDSFALLGIGVSGMMYQLFDGVSEDEYDVQIDIKDERTEDVFDTVHYPEDMETIEDLGDLEEME